VKRVVIALLVAAGCSYDPAFEDCAVACADECPGGFHCVAGWCRPLDDDKVCDLAPADAAFTPDAPPETPDAAPTCASRGQVCDPVAQDCCSDAEELGCYVDLAGVAACAPAGSLPGGLVCFVPGGNECAPGYHCATAPAGGEYECRRYCDSPRDCPETCIFLNGSFGYCE
jgi:hypothetical protein